MILKICGITNREDALAAIEFGATALGFNFYARSPRFVQPAEAAAISAILPPSVLRVGVFVNEPPDLIEGVLRMAGLDVAQLHGDEIQSQYPRGFRVWKAVRVENGWTTAALDGVTAEAVLLDGPAGILYGGSGSAFPWSLAAGVARRVIVAGGLDASNVAEAITAAQPWGVDTCSRIESSPGRKDHEKMAAFLLAARKAIKS